MSEILRRGVSNPESHEIKETFDPESGDIYETVDKVLV